VIKTKVLLREFVLALLERTGIYFVFIQAVIGPDSNVASAGTLRFPDKVHKDQFLGPTNIIVASHNADDVFKHEVGHVFGLPHVASPGNLMCGPIPNPGFWDTIFASLCTTHFSTTLTPDQLNRAKANAAKLEEQ